MTGLSVQPQGDQMANPHYCLIVCVSRLFLPYASARRPLAPLFIREALRWYRQAPINLKPPQKALCRFGVRVLRLPARPTVGWPDSANCHESCMPEERPRQTTWPVTSDHKGHPACRSSLDCSPAGPEASTAPIEAC